MDVELISDPSTFLDAAGPLLLEDEARHNLILGLAGTLRDHPEVYPDFRLWVVRSGNEPVGAALRTPPFNLVLARPREDAALEALADAIEGELPGVVGSVPEVHQFADLWAGRSDVQPHVHIAQGLYQLERVEPVTRPLGAMRDATPTDRPLLVDWYTAFVAEALGGDGPTADRIEQQLDHRLHADDAGLVFWEDDGPVALAGFGGPTPNGIRIGPVYTPPERRNRGYGTALTADLSSRLLAGGRRFCFLYTDLSNPASNKIYERIGYRRICESAEVHFQTQTTK
jgi:uncharacterized protein